MKKIRELLNKPEIVEDLEIEKTSADIVRLLYVAPLLNSDGYYRMILPYLELGKVEGIETRITSVTKWDFAKTFTLSADTLYEEEILWADYIIFPMLTDDYTFFFKAMKVLNPKVYLVMDVTRQIHNIPKSHADYKIYSKYDQEQLVKNIDQMDMITSPSNRLCQIYRFWLDTFGHNSTEVFHLPSLISRVGFEDISSITKPQDNVIRVGMIGTIKDKKDFKYFLPLLKRIKEKYKDKVELVIFGWNGKNKKGIEVLKEVDITYHKSVSFLNYYETLKNLHLDIVLIPMRSLQYYAFVNTIKFLEAAAIGIPVIALTFSAFRDEIKNGENGFLAWKLSEWEEKLIELIENPTYRKQLGENARKWVWKNRVYNQKNIVVFKNIFI